MKKVFSWLVSKPAKALVFFLVHFATFIALPTLIVPAVGATPFIIPVFITLGLVGSATYLIGTLWVSDFMDEKLPASKSLFWQRVFFGLFAVIAWLWVIVPLIVQYGGWWIVLFSVIGGFYLLVFGITFLMDGKGEQ